VGCVFGLDIDTRRNRPFYISQELSVDAQTTTVEVGGDEGGVALWMCFFFLLGVLSATQLLIGGHKFRKGNKEHFHKPSVSRIGLFIIRRHLERKRQQSSGPQNRGGMLTRDCSGSSCAFFCLPLQLDTF
jgi:hypothetical protein